MDEKMEKKVWSTPVLSVLTRTRPQETVLSACKALEWPGGGPYAEVSTCHEET